MPSPVLPPSSPPPPRAPQAAGGWRLWPRQVLAWPVRAYRLLLSPWLGSACRFEPTCSRYALQALARHGALAGSGLTVARVLRCHPWCPGGHDPVPLARPRLFRHLVPAATLPDDAPGAPVVAPAPSVDPLTRSSP